LRITGGKVRGRKILSPSGRAPNGLSIRPTSARAREALFNIIKSRSPEATVLDLYAGTGAFGLEALSRGARFAVFVDTEERAIRLIKKNIDLCGLSSSSLVIRRDLTKGLFFLRRYMPPEGFDLAFIDPPYKKKMGPATLTELEELDLICSKGMVIVEACSNDQMPKLVSRLQLFDKRLYGEAGFWFYLRQEA